MKHIVLPHLSIAAALLLTGSICIADAPSAKPKPAPVSKKPVFFGSLRVRPESYSWFEPVKPGTANNDYTFTGAILRAGVMGPMPGGNYLFEAAAPGLWSFPDDAAAPKPVKALGPGANYFLFSGERHTSLFVKQALVTFTGSNKRNSLGGGRFEYSDGTETKPTDSTLSWLQAARIGQRLIGPFGYTDIGRSFDGIKVVHNEPKFNVTAIDVSPTQGVFDINGDNNDLDSIKLDYLALTLPQTSQSAPRLARLFGIWYVDDRAMAKVDNRPAAAIAADHGDIRIGTVGADYLRVIPMSIGKVDVVLWGVDQFGKWGNQNQSSYAYDGEIGVQPKCGPWHPWLRAGYYDASGDSNPNDGEHNSFFPIMPTPRIYARFPFYSETNLKDAFAQLILRPDAKAVIRADYHSLSLASSGDLWYQGGGAFVSTGNFGYAGIAGAPGQSSLATMADVSLDYKVSAKTSIGLYYARATPGDAIKNVVTSHTASLTYVELLQTFG